MFCIYRSTQKGSFSIKPFQTCLNRLLFVFIHLDRHTLGNVSIAAVYASFYYNHNLVSGYSQYFVSSSWSSILMRLIPIKIKSLFQAYMPQQVRIMINYYNYQHKHFGLCFQNCLEENFEKQGNAGSKL